MNHVACCASGASCTGVIGAGTTDGNGNGGGGGGGGAAAGTVTNGNGQVTVLSTNGIIVTAGPATNNAAAAAVANARWVDWVVVGIVGVVVGVV